MAPVTRSRNRSRRPSVEEGVIPALPAQKSDLNSIILLVILYLLQGVPLGLCLGSVPYLLKSKLSFSQIALFSLSSYPYSIKLLWSPIVDTLYFKSLGRRKSWIIPIQAILGLALLFIGSWIDETLLQPEIPVTTLAVGFTLLVFLCATQDIAVDGWAVELLTEENKTYASTAQSIGLNAGYFLSFTVFLAFNSPEFCNKYIYSTPHVLGTHLVTQVSFRWVRTCSSGASCSCSVISGSSSLLRKSQSIII